VESDLPCAGFEFNNLSKHLKTVFLYDEVEMGAGFLSPDTVAVVLLNSSALLTRTFHRDWRFRMIFMHFSFLP